MESEWMNEAVNEAVILLQLTKKKKSGEDRNIFYCKNLLTVITDACSNSSAYPVCL